jgi:hypothetical protein
MVERPLEERDRVGAMLGPHWFQSAECRGPIGQSARDDTANQIKAEASQNDALMESRSA